MAPIFRNPLVISRMRSDSFNRNSEAPLTVVTYVLVKRLYVIEALHTLTPIPGEKAD